MHIDRQIAIWGGWIAGPAFGVAMMAAPDYLKLEPVLSGILFWGGIGVFVITLAVVVILLLHDQERKRKVMGPILVMAAGALIFGGGVAWYFWPPQLNPPKVADVPPVVAPPTLDAAKSPPPMPTLLEFFKSDFPETAHINRELTIKDESDGFTLVVLMQIYQNFDANTEFVAFYLPHSARTFAIAQYIAGSYKTSYDDLRKSVLITSKAPGEVLSVKSGDFVFSGRLYLYYEDEMSLAELAALEEAFRKNGAVIQFRSRDYAVARWLDLRSKEQK